jgi:hypothetical protein
MRKLILLGLAFALLLIPARALAADTKVERDQQAVGSIVGDGAGRWLVENEDYSREADIKRVGRRRFNFIHEGEVIGWVSRVTARRWNVHSHAHSEPIGYVEKTGKNNWHAYVDQSAVGEATGSAAIQGAASVLLIFHH